MKHNGTGKRYVMDNVEDVVPHNSVAQDATRAGRICHAGLHRGGVLCKYLVSQGKDRFERMNFSYSSVLQQKRFRSEAA